MKNNFQVSITVRELVKEDGIQSWVEHRTLSARTNYETAEAIIKAANGLLQPDDED